jgi:cyclomaltodextrinase / maltogenic alpha-amylase / neopullulanase
MKATFTYKLLFCFLSFSIALGISNSLIAQNKTESVPEWAKKVVWYQIFPERFSNGDKTNDPAAIDMKGAWPYSTPSDWQIHPWTSDWYKLQLWETGTSHDFYWNAGLRRYGGDLQGIINKLEYIQDLGITAIYLNPIFESPSLHKYDASMYHHIDNNFGPDPDLDREIWKQEDPGNPETWKWTSADSLFLQLIKECHDRNIKIIIDGVFNHVGTTFWAFQDILKNQEKSLYKDWFTIKKWDDPKTEENEFDYAYWMGARDLPEFKEDENGLVDVVKEHIHAVVKRWMDPNQDGDPSDGIDGWRLDVAEKVNIKFWQEFRIWIREINPEAYTTGELWWEDWPNNEMVNPTPWFTGNAFDAVMNYRFANAVKEFIIDKKNKISATEFVDSINSYMKDYPIDNTYVLQNLMDSHDVDRLPSQIINPDNWYDHKSNPGQNPDYDVRKPNEAEILIQKFIIGIQMTLPGAPMIYYGDEAGMWGGDDPDCRKPMIWPEMNYEAEVSHPFNKPRPKDEVSYNQELSEWYKKLINIRNENEVLALGDLNFFLIDDANNILGYERTMGDDKLFIILNNQDKPIEYKLNINELLPDADALEELVSDKEYQGNNGVFELSIEPYQILILTGF